MVRILDYLGNVKPKDMIFRLLMKKKPELAEMIKSIEKETAVAYPDLYLVYAMIFEEDDSSHFVSHGVTSHRRSVNGDKIFSEVVYLSGFSLIMLDKDVLVGVLIEELLHYLFRTVCLANQKSWKGLPDKQMMEPINEWFKDQYFIDCFQKAQAPFRAQDRSKLKAWEEKKYPVIAMNSLPKFEADKDKTYTFHTDPQLLGELQRRGKISLLRT